MYIQHLMIFRTFAPAFQKRLTDKKEKYEIIRTKEQYAAWRIAHRTLRMSCLLHRWHGLGESSFV